QVVGAYLSSAFLLFIIGITGYFDKAVRMIPQGIAAGMIAGILLQFGLRAFEASTVSPLLGCAMILAYLLSRRYLPRYNIVLVALTGFTIAFLMGQTGLAGLSMELARPVFIAPEFDFATFLSFTLPLTLVSLTGQFLPGMTILNLSGYKANAKAIIMITAIASMLVAFTGGITIVLAAITAAICTGKDAHEKPEKRYIAGISNGVFYLVGGLFAGTIVLLFTALPKELITMLAGLALIGAITSNLGIVIEDAMHREASLLTFLATASGMTVLGLGSAFWGIVIGLLAFFIMNRRNDKTKHN
ncbi:MAG: benzoate/H(+) symporter BenE family transporter, partial [Alcaligenaceae bacterium]|nr:benzoate/H(+) symporter BenE family transporter [Alcaligenaceae bacterium]